MAKNYDLKQGVYIMSIDGADIFRENKDYYKGNVSTDYMGFNKQENNNKLLTKEQKRIMKHLKLTNSLQENKTVKDKHNKFMLGMLYSVKLPCSLALFKLYDLIENDKKVNEFKTDDYNKQWTDAVVNITFNHKYEEFTKSDTSDNNVKLMVTEHDFKSNDGNKKIYTIKKKNKPSIIYDTKTIRTELYNKGFYIDGVKYINFMRSSSKARVGSCLFIKEEYYKDIIDWARLGLELIGNVDIASIRAYEALILSSIINVVKINPDEILMIDDIHSKFSYPASVATLRDNNISVENVDEYRVNNCVFDGQGLLDVSIFDSCKDTKGRGMMLLRNKWFKCCCFNTNVHDFLMSEENKNVIDENGCITDMCGNKIKAAHIKMIITPSSLKFLKMKDKFDGNIQDTYNYWLDNINSNFGIVKTDHDNLDYARILSYQMINSLPLSNEEVIKLLAEEFAYIELLKNDYHVVSWHIGEYMSMSNDPIFNLLKYNKDIANTDVYQQRKNKLVEKYKEKLLRGEIKLSDTDYSTMVANPYEMLLCAVGKFNVDKDIPLHGERELYCKYFNDGQQLAAFRNPNICAGNVMRATNVYHNEFDKWFNFTDNIAVMNFIGDNVPDRLQGCDTDSDSILLSSNSILINKAKIVDDRNNNGYFYTPVSNIDGKKNLIEMTGTNMADIDNTICKNYIGTVINKSQLLNSYYWKYCKDNNMSEETKNKILSEIYEKISLLSSLSQLEIDKAKKYFDNFNTKLQLDSINKIGIFNDENNQAQRTIIKNTVNNENKNKYMDMISLEAELLNKMHQETVDNDILMQYKKELKELIQNISNDLSQNNVTEKTKIKKPEFFKYIDKNVEQNIYEYFECPMDYVIKNIENMNVKTNQTGVNKKAGEKKYYSISKYFNNIDGKYNDKQIPVIEDIISNMRIKIDRAYVTNTTDDKDGQKDFRVLKRDSINEAQEQLNKLVITPATMQYIIKCSYAKSKKHEALSKNKSYVMELLYNYNSGKFFKVFKKGNTTTKLEQVLDNENSDYTIFGKSYKIISVGE